MRKKEEILHSSLRALDKIPKEGKVMVEHEHLFLEVWIDIRDSLNRLPSVIAANLLEHTEED